MPSDASVCQPSEDGHEGDALGPGQTLRARAPQKWMLGLCPLGDTEGLSTAGTPSRVTPRPPSSGWQAGTRSCPTHQGSEEVICSGLNSVLQNPRQPRASERGLIWK